MNFAAFDLNLLRVFDAMMRERSATRAGERLGLSQPAVSSALNRLRYACGDKLFLRRGNDMIPTPRAEELAQPIRAALGEVERALGGAERFDPKTAERSVTLLGADILSSTLIPSLSARLRRQAPGITLRFLDSARGGVEKLLRDDLIDIAIEPPLDLPDWISRQEFFKSRFVIIAARKHRVIAEAGVRPGARLPAELFCSLPQAIRSVDGSLRGLVDEALERKGLSRKVVLGVPHFHGLAATVAEGDLIAAFPVEFATIVAPQLKLAVYAPPIDIPGLAIQLYWHKRHDRSPAHLWLRQQLVAANRF